MKYLEFKLAALRHLESCEHIMSHFTPAKSAKENRLLWNTYYLSGYVIECSLKFAFFKSIEFEDDRNIADLNHGIYTYSKLETHQLDILKSYLIAVNNSLADTPSSGGEQIPFLNQTIANEDHKALINRWNSKIRYSSDFARVLSPLNPSLIENYLSDVVKPIFDKLTK